MKESYRDVFDVIYHGALKRTEGTCCELSVMMGSARANVSRLAPYVSSDSGAA